MSPAQIVAGAGERDAKAQLATNKLGTAVTGPAHAAPAACICSILIQLPYFCAGQESGTPEPEGPATIGRSRYRLSPTVRGLPPLQISPPEAASPDVSLSEGAVSPREQEAAQQMQALHQGVGAYTGFGREGPTLGQVLSHLAPLPVLAWPGC